MEITINFDLTTLIIGILLGLCLGLFIRLFRKNKRKRNVITDFKTIELNQKPQKKLQERQSTSAKDKYANSTLKNADKERIMNQLLVSLEKEKVYEQSNLTLAKLAKKLIVPKHHLSQTINEKTALNFVDFINQYRVRAAEGKLQDSNNQHLTLLDVGQQVGFNSKSTFYAVFKKHTQQTPGEYRKAISQSVYN